MTEDKLKPCECGEKPRLYSAAGEFRIKCSCGIVGTWEPHSLGALVAWNTRTGDRT